jgi:hypothetical protein
MDKYNAEANISQLRILQINSLLTKQDILLSCLLINHISIKLWSQTVAENNMLEKKCNFKMSQYILLIEENFSIAHKKNVFLQYKCTRK